MLCLYAVSFSFAYLSLSTGAGALILFAAVQITMIGTGFYSGERPRSLEWLGLFIAIAGLVYLVSPGL
jgi:drug/metabolite transporter (DMT)-like permease